MAGVWCAYRGGDDGHVAIDVDTEGDDAVLNADVQFAGGGGGQGVEFGARWASVVLMWRLMRHRLAGHRSAR